MTFENIFAVLVVCGIPPESSPAFRSLADSGVRLVVCDNGIKDFGGATFCKSLPNVRYINMGGNLGLPKAYNAALDLLGPKESLVCFFDEDARVPPEYFPRLCGAAERERGFDIFVPFVCDEVGLLSPYVMRGNFSRRAGFLSDLKGDFGAINSGMAVRAEIFGSFRYDENLFLDFVDRAFLREMKRRGKRVFILKDVSLMQSFSANADAREKAAARFRSFKRDAEYYYRDAPSDFRREVLRRRLSLCLKFKTPEFLFM